MAKKKNLYRASFRKNRAPRTRSDVWSESYHEPDLGSDENIVSSERISGKGELTRKRTVVGDLVGDESTGFAIQVDVSAQSRAGRVLSVHGLTSNVQDEHGEVFKCSTRGLLKTLSTEQRHVVAAGDRVMFAVSGKQEGVIERIEPRYGVLSRTSRRRQHIMVANVDQILIIGSAAEPYLKPHLIDRFLLSAEKSGIRPVICINKADLVDLSDLQPLIGVFSQMGYQVICTSTYTGLGMERLRRELQGRSSVIVGQSGVGKSSILNAVESGLHLRVGSVSEESQKGRHTTTTAQLLSLELGGFVVDTPGIRQFQLWDVIPGEVAGYFRDLRPYVNHCRFPNCSHTHESPCAVKDAVADGRLDARRYESYCQLFEGDLI